MMKKMMSVTQACRSTAVLALLVCLFQVGEARKRFLFLGTATKEGNGLIWNGKAKKRHFWLNDDFTIGYYDTETKLPASIKKEIGTRGEPSPKDYISASYIKSVPSLRELSLISEVHDREFKLRFVSPEANRQFLKTRRRGVRELLKQVQSKWNGVKSAWEQMDDMTHEWIAFYENGTPLTRLSQSATKYYEKMMKPRGGEDPAHNKPEEAHRYNVNYGSMTLENMKKMFAVAEFLGWHNPATGDWDPKWQEIKRVQSEHHKHFNPDPVKVTEL